MNLKFVSCSGANEHTKIDSLLSLLSDFPTKAEVCIQVSGKKAASGSARYWWLRALYYQTLRNDIIANFALHLNQDWVERFCAGQPPCELTEFLSWENCIGRPFFGRVQLNFKIGREQTPDPQKLINAIRKYPRIRFILSYSDNNAEFIGNLHRKRLFFDCLYDNSHGEGITPANYAPPAFDDILQGYSGGISPDNVASVLENISRVVPDDAEIFIDAEGKLKGDDGHFSLEKCRTYLENALNF